MNTNPQLPNGTFRFPAVVDFEIDPETAAALLVGSDPSKTLSKWIGQARIVEGSGSFNASNLRTALNEYLGERAIEKARLLLPDADPKTLPF